MSPSSSRGPPTNNALAWLLKCAHLHFIRETPYFHLRQIQIGTMLEKFRVIAKYRKVTEGHLNGRKKGNSGGAGGTRTRYLFNAIEALSQMSYSPTEKEERPKTPIKDSKTRLLLQPGFGWIPRYVTSGSTPGAQTLRRSARCCPRRVLPRTGLCGSQPRCRGRSGGSWNPIGSTFPLPG